MAYPADAAPRAFEGLIGESPAMRQLLSRLDRIADCEATVLITGETGTGKELVARAVHNRSRRNGAPFVAINCAALPDALVESELFGHVRGAFTDARTGRKGLLRQAEAGTLLLDEIGDLPLALQPKLLRALEEHRYRPVGSDRESEFDVRILAATHRDLEGLVDRQHFREDLYFRINVIQLGVPPLRDRDTDILLLARESLRRAATLSGKQIKDLSPLAAQKLREYPWPGNVRELLNAISHGVALATGERLDLEDLPEKIRTHRPEEFSMGVDDTLSDLVTLEEIERRYILHVLKATDGNRAAAAKTLGLDRTTLYRKLRRFER